MRYNQKDMNYSITAKLANKTQRKNRNHAGFTAVELLATLFVAAVFLLSGYTLYNTIMMRSGDARQRVQADNIAFDYLRRYQSSATNPCTNSTPATKLAITSSAATNGLTNPTATVQVSCPNTAIQSLSLVTVIIEYQQGANTQQVRQELYVTQ